MPDITFRGRRAISIENDSLRVTVLREGGHIAELLDKESGIDPRVVSHRSISSTYTAHLINSESDCAYFIAFHPQHSLAMGYVWKQKVFCRMGIWEENCSRKQTPWLGQTIARGTEFRVSPMPESRRQMVNRNQLFGVPTYRWLPAKSSLEVEYFALIRHADRIPESLEWPV